jgi:hypothetical protein
MSRRAVGVTLAVLGSVGLVIALAKLTPSLLLFGRGRLDAVTLEVRDLALGAYRAYDGRNSRLYVVRTPSDEVWAFIVPVRAGKVALPDGHWGRPAFNCSDFRPDAKDGAITPNSLFRCRDVDVPAWGVSHWRWRLDGKSAAEASDTHIEDMPRVKVERSGGVIRVNRWDILW